MRVLFTFLIVLNELFVVGFVAAGTGAVTNTTTITDRIQPNFKNNHHIAYFTLSLSIAVKCQRWKIFCKRKINKATVKL